MSADVTEAELRARANRAAAGILAKVALPTTLDRDTLVSLLSVGWLEGWQAGADEVRALLRESFEAFVSNAEQSCGNPSCVEHGVDRHRA